MSGTDLGFGSTNKPGEIEFFEAGDLEKLFPGNVKSSDGNYPHCIMASAVIFWGSLVSGTGRQWFILIYSVLHTYRGDVDFSALPASDGAPVAYGSLVAR